MAWCHRALDLRLQRSRVRIPALHFQVTTLGKLFTHVCLCHQAVWFGTSQGAVMPCGWENNRRSGVTLAMRHRFQWFIHLQAHGLDREMSKIWEISASLLDSARGTALFTFILTTQWDRNISFGATGPWSHNPPVAIVIFTKCYI